MKYQPMYPPDLVTEVRRLAQVLQELEAEFYRLEPVRAAPARGVAGLLAYADGVAWSPAGGAGLQLHDGSSWQRLLTTPIGEHVQDALTADVQLLVAGTWYDGPDVTVGAGTWLLLGRVEFQAGTSTAARFSARIHDGTTAHASGSGAGTNTNARCITLSVVVTPTASTTYTLQGSTATGAATNVMSADANYNASGDHATMLTAVRLR